MLSVQNVQALKKLDTSALYDGQSVYVEGYFNAGDGGEKIVHFVKGSTAADDGGMHHQAQGGCFAVKGNLADFSFFGIFGPEKDADDALEAMCTNQKVTKIESKTALNFAKRHIINRNNLTFDFNNNAVTTNGCEKAGHDDPFAAIFSFRGRLTGKEHCVTLDHPLQELNDIFPVEDSSVFNVYAWYIIKCDRLFGVSEYQIDKLIQVTEIIDETHIRVGYKMGWQLEAGRTLTYRECLPVKNITFRNMRFYATAGDQYTGTHPLAFEYAVDTDIEHIYSQDNFWPLCIRRHNTRFSVSACELVNPCEVVVGGTGYLAQNINCLYGSVRDCRVSNARHLNDFTGSAYCQVENCHGDGDWCGAFVTHGQYEHDLSYVGNSGLLSFANSGTPWGNSAKRITVTGHSASRIIAYTKISDLTLINCHAYKRQEKKDYRYEAYEFDSGTIWLNCDGAQLQGCTAEGGLKLSSRSCRSGRRTIISGCSINQPEGYSFKLSNELPDAARVDFIDCDLYGCEQSDVDGIEDARFINTEFHRKEGKA